MRNNLKIYIAPLTEIAISRCGARPSVEELMEWLAREGLLDPTRSKAMVTRSCVAELISQGHKKIEAMQLAADRYCCSYESVRRYEYSPATKS